MGDGSGIGDGTRKIYYANSDFIHQLVAADNHDTMIN